MKPEILLLVNPCSGRRKAVSVLPQIVTCFAEGGYETKIYLSTRRGEITELAEHYGGTVEKVVCVGGDGTLNETISGLIQGGHSTPVGYIPAGTTNDLAKTLGLATNMLEAASDIVTGVPVPLDIGSIDGRYFVYTASFGAFTKASYAADQTLKNSLGHAAYVLEAMRDIPSIKTIPVKVDTETDHVEGNMLFGSISNSTSLGGVLKLDPTLVSLNDGKFEVMLLEQPKDIIGYYSMIECLVNQHYDNEYIHLLSAAHVQVEFETDRDWTVDGEYCPGKLTRDIVNHHSAINLLTKRQDMGISFGI